MNFRKGIAVLLLVATIWSSDAAISLPSIAQAQDDFSCADVSEIPLIECEVLVAIDEANPDAHFPSNWFSSNAPCIWLGIRCAEGQITELSMFPYGLTSLPSEISNLSALTRFNLNFNQLTSLPPEIGNLSSLTQLHLEGNGLTSLPLEIGNLSSLTWLDMWGNELASLPSEIGNLASLTHLDLRRNELTSLPPEIGNLSSLTKLYLRNNPLPNVPATFVNLSESVKRQIRFDGIIIDEFDPTALEVQDEPQVEQPAQQLSGIYLPFIAVAQKSPTK